LHASLILLVLVVFRLGRPGVVAIGESSKIAKATFAAITIVAASAFTETSQLVHNLI